MLPVIRRFFNFGDAISRYTCASVSKPLIESSEWPNAMMIATIGNVGQTVPWNQPRLSPENWRLDGIGGGGTWATPRIRIVSGHQIRNATTITDVICIIRSALPLDSCIPLMLARQKYPVTRIPKNA